MRITFLLTQDLESPSGLGRYLPLARGLVGLGHQVTVAALHADFDSLEHTRFRQEGVDIWYVGQMHVRKRANRKMYYPARQLVTLALQATRALTHAVQSVPSDVVHIGKPHPMNSLAGIIARYCGDKCLFLDYDDYEAASNRFSSEWQRWGVSFFENQIPRRVHHITTHNRFLENRLRALGVPPERITYLPNGVDHNRFGRSNPARVASLRSELRLAGKQVVAFIGSLSSPSHPIDLLLDTFRLIHEAQPNSVLLIVGGGEDYDRLQKRIQDMGLGGSVLMCGHIPADQVPDYYRLAHVSVEPVHDDSIGRGRLPLKLFESWASGIPFVTADVGDRRTILGSPPAGVLVRPGDPAALSQGILGLLASPEQQSSLRKLGLERVRRFYWSHLARIVDTAYSEVTLQLRSGDR
jgi:glycosyltransferase involved in cell wall biosynthesis